jgi:hypothetical protein
MINPEAERADIDGREFGRIPDYVTPGNRKRILELSRPNEKEISQVECSEYLIRHWLETVEDANPLYNDREYARSRGFRDIIAQPGMNICTLVMPYRWPMAEFHKTRQLLHFEVKELLELPVGILANYETFFYRPVEIARNWSVALTPTCFPMADRFAPGSRARMMRRRHPRRCRSALNRAP